MSKINQQNTKKQIGIGAVLSYISIGVNILAGLLYTPWMVKTIGQSDYSLFTLANSLITLFLVDFGLSAATARFIAVYKAEGNQEQVNNFIGAIYKLYILVDIILLVIFTTVFFFIDGIYASLTQEELSKLKVVYIIAGSYSLISLPFVTLNGILTAYEKFIQLKLGDLIYRFLVVGLTVVALLSGLGLYAIVSINAIVGLTVIIYKLSVIHRETTIRVCFKYKDTRLFKQIFSFSVWTTLTVLSQRLIFNITPTILGITHSSTSIAVFGIVTTIEGYAYTLTSAINGMFMTRISQLNLESENGTKLTDLMIRVGRFQFGLNGLIIVGFSIVGDAFIKLWMGPEYSQAYAGIILVLVPGIFFNSLQIANTTFIVRGKVKYQAIIGAIVGLINVMISAVLSSLYGVTGACISICVAYCLRTILFIIADEKVLGFDMRRFIRQCYFKMLPSVLLTLFIGLIFKKFVDVGNWFALCAQGAIVVLIYVCTLFITLGKTEWEKLLRSVALVFQQMKSKN